MPAVLTDLNEGVQTITLNEPDKLNALSAAMLQELSQVVRGAERDDGIRALVFSGAGRAFSAGADVTEFEFGDGPPDLGMHLRSRVNPFMARVHALEKPVLAALNGVAAGIGFSLALACDLRFAAESARIVLAFSRIGLVPDGGMLYFLPRLIGPAKTLELAWTSDPIGAQEAYELGMLNGVVPDAELLGHTQELAARLAHGPATALGLIKRGVNQAHELPLDRVMDLEASYQTIAARHANFGEGLAAFRDKRPPTFSH